MTTTIERNGQDMGQGQNEGQAGAGTGYSGQSNNATDGISSKQAKRMARNRKNKANKASSKANAKLSTHVTMASIQASAKQLAKVLSADEIDTRAQYWERVDAIQEAITPLKSESERKALFSLTQAQMALEGKTAIKNQDIRHWVCAADARESYPELKLEQYGENKLERTILKWLKGSFTDVLKHGQNCFIPRDDEVKLPDGTTAKGGEIFAKLRDFVELYAADKQREKTTPEVRAKKAGERIASFLNKENKREKSNIVTVMSAFVETLDEGMRVKLYEALTVPIA